MEITKKELSEKIRIKIPKYHKLIWMINGSYEVKRPDGLTVFLSEKDDILINQVRLYATDKKQVITIIGLYRGMQISNNYAKKYDKKDNTGYLKFISNILNLLKIDMNTNLLLGEDSI